MKSILRPLFALLFCGLLTSSALAQGRIATVDLRKIFDNYWRTKQADAVLKDQAAGMDKEHKGFVDDWTKAKEDYQKLLTSANDQAISAEERDRRKTAAEKKLVDIKELEQTIAQYERTATTTINEKKMRMRSNILTEIRTVINAKAKSVGYALVLDTAAETKDATPIVVYANNENDLTDTVLTQLNANAPVDLPKDSDTKNPPPATSDKK